MKLDGLVYRRCYRCRWKTPFPECNGQRIDGRMQWRYERYFTKAFAPETARDGT